MSSILLSSIYSIFICHSTQNDCQCQMSTRYLRSLKLTVFIRRKNPFSVTGYLKVMIFKIMIHKWMIQKVMITVMMSSSFCPLVSPDPPPPPCRATGRGRWGACRWVSLSVLWEHVWKDDSVSSRCFLSPQESPYGNLWLNSLRTYLFGFSSWRHAYPLWVF